VRTPVTRARDAQWARIGYMLHAIRITIRAPVTRARDMRKRARTVLRCTRYALNVRTRTWYGANAARVLEI